MPEATRGSTHAQRLEAQALRVGTDCSGLEAPIMALDKLGIKYQRVFSSETDEVAIKLHKANF